MICEQCGKDERVGALMTGDHVHHLCLSCVLKGFKGNVEDKLMETLVALFGLNKL